jgi:hypothetical protein
VTLEMTALLFEPGFQILRKTLLEKGVTKVVLIVDDGDQAQVAEAQRQRFNFCLEGVCTQDPSLVSNCQLFCIYETRGSGEFELKWMKHIARWFEFAMDPKYLIFTFEASHSSSTVVESIDSIALTNRYIAVQMKSHYPLIADSRQLQLFAFRIERVT